MASTFTHDPNAILDYYIDWSAWLEANNYDSIVTSAWTSSLAGATLTLDGESLGITHVWVQVPSTQTGRITLTNHITTAAGRQDDRTITLILTQR